MDASDNNNDDHDNNPKLENVDIFWQRFDELVKKDNGGRCDQIVDHGKLKERLVSSGKFYVGEAQYAIEQNA